MKTLLIGIGNPLRRDDGAGPVFVERFGDLTDCEKLIVHQLLPEHIERLATVDRVVFIDAAVDVDVITFNELQATSTVSSFGHVCDPSGLMTLCESLHGRIAQAFVLKLPAHDLNFGEGLSPEMHVTCQAAERLLLGWLHE